MSEPNVLFFSEDVDFILQDEIAVKEWVRYVVTNEGHSIESANVIFCSDQHILTINNEYLGHDYFTDIITFPLMDAGATIETDIFISIDTVRSNAADRDIPFEKELLRVIVHGFLHMLGYGDKTDMERIEMRAKEDYYLDYFYGKYL